MYNGISPRRFSKHHELFSKKKKDFAHTAPHKTPIFTI